MINFRLVRHLWSFLAVAEEQHFGRAAKRLNMSQPPLTEQIQVLENALKVKLFIRSRRGAQLTPIGLAILPAVRKFANQTEQLELAVREAAAGQTGTLTIGAVSLSMMEVLPNLLDQLRTAHPRLTIAVREIDSADAVPSLETGEIDLAFARLQGDLGDSIETMPLINDHLAVALTESHTFAGRDEISLSELADEIFVMFTRRFSPVYFDNIIAACHESGFSPRILHEVRTVAAQVAFVGCGQGIALVPSNLRLLSPANVLIRPLKEKIEVVTTAAAWSTVHTNPSLTAVLELLRGAKKQASTDSNLGHGEATLVCITPGK